jgi:putative (di)nucleoside polyphosphate hydrolase
MVTDVFDDHPIDQTERLDNGRLYRLGVGIALRNPGGQIFVGQRSDQADASWQMPQGGLDAGESPLQALWRELAEEVGIGKAQVKLAASYNAADQGWSRYDVPDDFQPTVLGGRYHGQCQRWFALDFVGDDADIRLDAIPPAEFRDWRWVDAVELPGLIVPFKRELYQQLQGWLATLPPPRGLR